MAKLDERPLKRDLSTGVLKAVNKANRRMDKDVKFPIEERNSRRGVQHFDTAAVDVLTITVGVDERHLHEHSIPPPPHFMCIKCVSSIGVSASAVSGIVEQEHHHKFLLISLSPPFFLLVLMARPCKPTVNAVPTSAFYRLEWIGSGYLQSEADEQVNLQAHVPYLRNNSNEDAKKPNHSQSGALVTTSTSTNVLPCSAILHTAPLDSVAIHPSIYFIAIHLAPR
ncbi:unnamed protein product [Taenia asiatica]|uniref:Uncharacterized protein n=1 Tax=Taenia asiatica TaxID=60517 RepID=A0A0R3VVE9_TAEAS|nr:unnamed protein product [Taenia asiatica]